MNDYQASSQGIPPPEAIHTPLRGRVYAALQKLRGHPLGDMVTQLREWERLPAGEFERQHAQRLAATLEHARATVPLYRTEPWTSTLSAHGEGLVAWPVLERETLLERYEELVAQPRPNRLVLHKTSGTTGKPARIVFTRDADTWGWAHRYRGLAWHGIPIGVRSLRLMQDRRPLRDWLLDQRNFPALDTPEALDRAIAYAQDARPLLVAGTPSALFYLARQLRERGVEQPLAPFARVGGEQLFPFQRTEIERFVGRRAIDSYGATEIGALSGECPAGSMHVYSEHVHLEIFRGDQPAPDGELGDIVATALHNPAMPLIRYRVGDQGRLSAEKCSCGLPHPVLLDVRARSMDVFRAPDGTVHHGAELVERLDRLFGDAAADRVRQVQFVQSDPAHWQVLIEAPGMSQAGALDDSARRTVEDRLVALVREVFGAGCHLGTSYVDALPRRAGKFRYYQIDRPAGG